MILNPQQIELMRLGMPSTPANDSGGGGGGGAPTQQTVTQTNLPEYAQPYFERLMARTEASSNNGYVPYSLPRVHGFTNLQNSAMNNVASMQEPAEIQHTRNIFNHALQGSLDSAQYQAGHLGSTYNPNATMGNMERIQSGFNPGEFDSAAAEKYMNPYTQNVIDVAKREAMKQHGMENVARDATAAQRGSFGGSRAALVNAEAARNTNQRLDDIQMRGMDQAYQQAQQQFERDRAAQQQAAQMGLGAQQFNAQQRMAYGQFDEGQRQKAAELGLQGQIANEQARAAAAGIQQRGYGMAGDLGSQFGELGRLSQGMAMDRNNMLWQMGNAQQAMGQRALDTAYDDFVNQRDFDKQQLAFYSGILRGVPANVNSNVQTTNSSGNMMGQLAGLGIAGLGAYNMNRG